MTNAFNNDVPPYLGKTGRIVGKKVLLGFSRKMDN